MSIAKKPITRRSALTLGAAGLLSGLLASLRWDEASADEPAATKRPAGQAKSCIVLWMNGGPSHIDTFDPKPGTKTGGSFKAINTRQTGVSISEHLPGIAEVMDEIALIRSVNSKEGNHQRAIELGHTGRIPNPTVQAPSIGAWIAKKRPTAALELPSFVSLGGPSFGAGFFGNSNDPFVVQRPGELPDDLKPARAVSRERDGARSRLLDSMEADFAASSHDSQIAERRALFSRARSMMGSKLVRAFDTHDEPEDVQGAYGDSDFGRGCIVARRLVEVGVPFIEVALDGWDTHKDNFERVADRCKQLDPAMASLVKELRDRKLLGSTLVVCMGEFGRSPDINGNDGRDHHPGAFSVAMAGGGVHGGLTYGETDAEGRTVTKDGVGVPDVIATIAKAMGLDPLTEERTPAGRPIQVTERGRPISAILG